MPNKSLLPRSAAPLVDATGRATPEFYRWLQSLGAVSGTDGEARQLIAEMARKLGSPDGSIGRI
ncbi:hypothetical protein, partial [Coralloluteibacterium thermophilus]